MLSLTVDLLALLLEFDFPGLVYCNKAFTLPFLTFFY